MLGKLSPKGWPLDSGNGGELVVSTAPAIGLPEDTLPFFSLSYAVGNLLASFSKPLYAVDEVLIPPGRKADDAQRLVEAVQAEAKGFGVKLVGGHTGAYEGIELPLITVTAWGKRMRQALKPSVGDRLYLFGEPFLESKWLDWLTGQAEVEVDWRKLTPVPILKELIGMKVKALHDVSEGGIQRAILDVTGDLGFSEGPALARLRGIRSLSDPSYGCVLAVVSDGDAPEFERDCEAKGIDEFMDIGRIGGERLSEAQIGSAYDKYGFSASSYDRYLNAYSFFLKRLSKVPCIRELVPEVGMNVAFWTPMGYVGADGRITRTEAGIRVGKPSYGASRHIGRVLDDVRRLGSDKRLALNIRLSDELKAALKRVGIQPIDTRGLDPFCPLASFIEETGTLADAYVEEPNVGVEGNVVLLFRDFDEVIRLLGALCEVLPEKK
ncbi:thiamine-phosphate synthase family protein [Tardisphaera miroshnichenkoae]